MEDLEITGQQAEYLEESSDLQASEQKPYSSLAEWFFTFLICTLLTEGIFANYLQAVLDEKGAWWTNITPFQLWPSELIFYGPILFVSIFVLLRGRSTGYRTARGLWLLAPLWAIGIVQMIHGKIAGAPGNFWLADFRQTVAMSHFAIITCILAPRIRVWKVADRVCKFAVILAIYDGVTSAMVFAGILDWTMTSPFKAAQYGEYDLAFIILLALARSIITGKSSKIVTYTLIFGLMVPLNKGPIVVWLAGTMAILFLVGLTSKMGGIAKFLRAAKLMLILGVFLFVLLGWVFTLGGGAAKEWINQRVFKTHVASNERDLTQARFALYKWGLEQWLQHPLFGTGFGHHPAVQTAEGNWRLVGVHNYYIIYLYQTGIICFAIVSAVFIIWLRRIYRYLKVCSDQQEYWVFVGMYAWVLSMLLNSFMLTDLGITSVGFIYWMCVGFLNNAEGQSYMARLYADEGTAYETDGAVEGAGIARA